MIERDFIGLIASAGERAIAKGKGLAVPALVSAMNLGCHDPAMMLGADITQWPHSSDITSLQQLMSYRNGFGGQPLPTMEAFDACCMAAPIQATQNFLNLDLNHFPQYPSVTKPANFYRTSVHKVNEDKMSPTKKVTNFYGTSVHQLIEANLSPPTMATNFYGTSVHQLNEAKLSPLSLHHSVPAAGNSSPFKFPEPPSRHNVVSNGRQENLFVGVGTTVIARNSLGAGFATNAVTMSSMKQQSFAVGAANAAAANPLKRKSVGGGIATTAVARNSMMQQNYGRGVAPNASTEKSILSSFAPRPMPTPSMSSHMTIFYSDLVSVYEDMPIDKVQDVIRIANQGTNASSKKQPYAAIHARAASSRCSTIKHSQPIKNMSQQRGGRNNINDIADAAKAKKIAQHVSSSKYKGKLDVYKNKGKLKMTETEDDDMSDDDTPDTASSGGVSQARKASLARFLEKRQERSTSVGPYHRIRTRRFFNAVNWKDECSSLSSYGVGMSSYGKIFWGLDRLSNKKDSELPNTNLEM